jgi:hypothetical protein
MTNRVQSLRSNVAGNRPPAGTLSGSLYVNWADGQIGSVNSTNVNQDLIGVRYFSSVSNYNPGDHVVQGGTLYRAIQAVPAGTFNPSQWEALSSGYNSTFRNRLINGGFWADQRNEGAIVTTNLTYGPDKWKFNGSTAGKLNLQRGAVTAASAAIIHSNYQCVLTSLSAYTAVATDVFGVFQSIEADAVSDLQWGASSALPVVLSFWAAASVAGTYAVRLGNMVGTRSYVTTFTLAAATWTYIQIPIPGDTGGTWVTSGNAASLQLFFDGGSGSTYQTSTLNAWQTGNYASSPSSMKLVATSGAVLQFANVQLEVGTVATPFEILPPDVILARCQRYYEKSYPIGTVLGSTTQLGFTQFALSPLVSAIYSPIVYTMYKVTKRAAPTITLYSPYTGASGMLRDYATSADVAATAQNVSATNFCTYIAQHAAATIVNEAYHWTADCDF